jgi:putative ABC transport system substrate-binding protein
VLLQSPTLVIYFDGFKAGMAELGYVEGKNVVYVYDGPTETLEALKPAAESLKSRKLDLLVTAGNPPTETAKAVFAGTQVPIVFVPAVNPVEDGLVTSLQNPGGNVTGVVPPNTFGKALEWLLKVMPDARRIYVPHNPQDVSSVTSLQLLKEAAETLGLEIVVAEGSTPEELDAITTSFPENVDAVFVPRAGTITARVNNLAQAAIERHIPSVMANTGIYVDSGLMLAYGPGAFDMGKQAARLADQILKGGDPATLPVENAEVFLGINLQTAETIGVEIPDSILNQAKQIVHPPAK